MVAPMNVWFGRYRLLEPLGHGGMAVVYRAVPDEPDSGSRTLVIKRILPNHSRDPHFVKMLISEARVSALLRHSAIVQMYELGSVEGEHYIAMEYVDGVNLRTVLRSCADDGAPPAARARLLRRQGGGGGAALRALARRRRWAPPRHRAPRRDPVERDDLALGRGQAARLRHRQGRAAHPRRSDDHGRAQGQDQLHVARAGERAIPSTRAPTSSRSASSSGRR